MHPVVGHLRYIPYNLILSRIIMGRWGPAVGTLSLLPPNVNSMPVNIGAVPTPVKAETLMLSQCPEFYAEDNLILSQAIYLGTSLGNFTKRHLKLHWWLIINSMWIWWVIPHHMEKASYYPVFSITPPNPVYLEFTLEKILIYNPEARTRETETIGREVTRVIIPPLLFCNKYNYLPTYLVPMTPPLTLWPVCLQGSVATNESTSTQIFGVM
ncbi:hypothetical protein DSO57_1003041 [Entomophthora muscae]|uniref:Uncharacterized protein n=1 Tax=Entomophthora muscae TaxID=34485 RepID=A0ACC2SXM1_9FUNG|nr:hypothetical protein DSO57_1003041 [Entomophthora muscae]